MYQKEKIHHLTDGYCTGWPQVTIYNGEIVWQEENDEKTRYLILEDGTVFKGNAFGAEEASIGEVIFTTGDDWLSRNHFRSIELWANR